MSSKIDKSTQIAGDKMSRVLQFCKKMVQDSLLMVSDQ
jgi:hypothetical protein